MTRHLMIVRRPCFRKLKQFTCLKPQIKKPTPFGMGFFVWGAWR